MAFKHTFKSLPVLLITTVFITVGLTPLAVAKKTDTNKQPATSSDIASSLSQQWEKGHYKDVVKEAKQAINVGVNQPEVYHYLARAQAQQGNTEAATKTLTELIAKHPKYAQSYLTFARLLEAQGKEKEAVDFYKMYVEKANRNIPRDPGLRLKLRHLGLY